MAPRARGEFEPGDDSVLIPRALNLDDQDVRAEVDGDAFDAELATDGEEAGEAWACETKADLERVVLCEGEVEDGSASRRLVVHVTAGGRYRARLL